MYVRINRVCMGWTLDGLGEFFVSLACTPLVWFISDGTYHIRAWVCDHGQGSDD
jgi:hypothetical protein